MPQSTIIIDNDLRTMSIPSDIVLLGVESDDDVKKISFQMPKEYCGYDLSTFEARINYMNAKGDGDIYIAEDLTVDGDNMTFTWIVGRNACMYKGDTQFIVCLKKFDNDQNVVQEFNTTVYSLPVLKGLETTEAVVQTYPDIIEYLLKRMQEAGVIDPNDYYTKSQIDSMIPTELPNPESLTINGQSYDGSTEVEMTIVAESEVLTTVSGKIIHTVDAVPGAIESLTLYDSSSQTIASAEVAVANKNLFRIDEIATQVVSNGITFDKNQDGSITADGTSTADDAETTCELDPYMFVVGKTYTLNSNKSLGNVQVKLSFTYQDESTGTVISMNSAKTFTVSKVVTECIASITVPTSGTSVYETVYPMLEVDNTASAFVMNSYVAIEYDGTTMPVLPDEISNIWANDASVASMTMEYTADTIMAKIDQYIEENVPSVHSSGTLIAQYDGVYTVELGLE